MAQLGAAGDGPFVIVLGPGEVHTDRLGLFAGGRLRDPPVQFHPALGCVPLFAEHDVEPVAEGVPGAGPDVVRGQRGLVQRPGPYRLLGGGTLPVACEDVLEERLHDVPRRHLPAFEAGEHPLGVTVPEDSAPAAAPVEPPHQPVQVPRELQYLYRELSYVHYPTPCPT
ncbi:hypothetical protein ACFV06_06580 [Streptomyces sp. NPDC059618]|uniref:hypothetical protein n=1 Tax=Streptomyces sp. NPDC059618 TaxID=3346887 RepID=UPI00369F464B